MIKRCTAKVSYIEVESFNAVKATYHAASQNLFSPKSVTAAFQFQYVVIVHALISIGIIISKRSTVVCSDFGHT